MQTETIDKLFLELSQITGATTANERHLQNEVRWLREALVYVAHAGHITPQHMLPAGVSLGDTNYVEVRLPNGRVVEAKIEYT